MINLNNPALGTIVAGTGGVDTLTGLTPASNYCFFVREICAPGDTSFWSIASCFQTACVPYTLPYVEDFPAWAIGSTEPLCFSSAGGTQKWDRYDAAGNIVARANFWSFTSGNTFILQSPQIIMNTSAELRFKWSHLYSSFYPDDEVTIYGRAVGATQWDTLISLVGAAFNSNDGAGNTTPGSFIWDTVALNPAWVGQTIELQLFANSGFGPSAFLDSVSVISTSTCPAPSSLASANSACMLRRSLDDSSYCQPLGLQVYREPSWCLPINDAFF